MDSTLYIALSRQAAVQRQLDVIANNIANMNTTAFQKESVMFQEYLVELPGIDSPAGNTVSFMQDYGVSRDFRAGDLEPTNNDLDLAINGPGFLTVRGEDGETLYTRNGHFRLSEDGYIVNSAGLHLLDDTGQDIPITEADVVLSISDDGTLTSNNGPLGIIGLVEFEELSSLRKVGDSVYSSTIDPDEAEESKILQGFLETSNVQGVEEMTKLIQVSRSYQSVANMLDKYQDMRSSSISALGKVG